MTTTTLPDGTRVRVLERTGRGIKPGDRLKITDATGGPLDGSVTFLTVTDVAYTRRGFAGPRWVVSHAGGASWASFLAVHVYPARTRGGFHFSAEHMTVYRPIASAA